LLRSLAAVEAGEWARLRPERVEVPASVILHNERWIAVRQGLQGLQLRDEVGLPVVYVLCQPSSHYYAVMTRSKWKPVLVGKQVLASTQ
jgi:hypothetical protein